MGQASSENIEGKVDKEGDDRNPLSYVVPGFLGANPDLIPHLTSIFDSILLPGSHGPSEGGDGISLTSDSPRGNKPTINVNRKSYIRQNFGKQTKCTHDPLTECRATYGTGSGMRTHGTPLWLV